MTGYAPWERRNWTNFSYRSLQIRRSWWWGPPTKLPINWRITKLLGRHGKNSEPALEWVRTLNPSNEQEQQILNSVLKNLEGRKYREKKK